MANITFEVQPSPSKSRADYKGANASYSREFLLSLAQLAESKRLPSTCSFDSSLICEIKDASSGSPSSDSEAGRWNSNLSQPLLPENGILGKGSILKEPKCVIGVSPPRFQGIGYRPSSRNELNNASTSFSPSSGDSASDRLDVNLSQHSEHNTEDGLLGSTALLRNPGCLVGVSAPMVKGSQYYQVNKSIKPYRPPHLYKAHLLSRRVHNDLYPDVLSPSSQWPRMGSEEEESNGSFGMTEKTDNSSETKQDIVSDEHERKLDPDASTYPNDFRNDEMVVNKKNQSTEVVASLAPHNACYHISILAAACKEKFHTSTSISEKGLETKSLNHSPIQEKRTSCTFEVQCAPPKSRADHKGPNASYPREFLLSLAQLAECKRLPSSCSFDSSLIAMGLETKSLNHSPMQENCNVKAEEINNCMLSSSNSVDRFTEEQKLACDISTDKANDKSEAHIPSNSADKHEPRSFSSGIIDHKTAIPSGSVKQSEGKGRNSVSDDDDDKLGGNSLTEQKFECDPAYIFDEEADAVNEICLPDEDSLISLDDLIFPGDCVFTPDNNVHKPAAFNPNILRNHPLAYVNPGTALFHQSGDRYQQNDPPRQTDSSINVLQDPSKHPPAESTRFDNSILRPLPHQMFSPCAFPHQRFRMPSNVPSDVSINERISHPQQQLNHTHNYNRSFPQQPYRGPYVPISGHIAPFVTAQPMQVYPPRPWF